MRFTWPGVKGGGGFSWISAHRGGFAVVTVFRMSVIVGKDGLEKS